MDRESSHKNIEKELTDYPISRKCQNICTNSAYPDFLFQFVNCYCCSPGTEINNEAIRRISFAGFALLMLHMFLEKEAITQCYQLKYISA
jgi:hypothetical protein